MKTNFSVTQFGKKLSKRLYTWDERTKTFSTKESNLVLDFIDVEGVASGVTFDMENCSSCTFITDIDCNFKTGNDCVFNTAWGCTFKVGENCVLVGNFYSWKKVCVVHKLLPDICVRMTDDGSLEY